MILFESDWLKYPRAIVDTQTTNDSFIRIARLYKSMGVKNHLFPLALLQPELQGVDPHSPNLTMEQKAMIALECKHNIWYHLREVVRIPAKGSSTAKQYKANRGNLAVTWLHMCNIDVANIQIRQTGKSVSTDCIMEWNIDIGAQNSLFTLITKDDKLRKENVKRLKEMRNLLPGYLVMVTKDDSDNQVEVTCRALNNLYTTCVAQNSEIGANNLGRGLTTPTIHSDEGPFTNYISISLPAALAAGTAAREEAEKAGAPYGNIFTTTAGKKDDRDGRFMYDMIHGGAVWTEVFLDARDKKHLRELVQRNCSNRKVLVNVTMNHRQLGFTDEWLYRAISDANVSGEAADRDFFNVWTSGTQSSPLSPHLNERIRNSESDVLHTGLSHDGYISRWYIDESQIEDTMANSFFVLGMDTSEAIGRDAVTMVVTDLSDLSQVMVGTFNETDLIRFSYHVANFLIKYPNVVFVIERKSTGIAVVDAVAIQLTAHQIDPFKRIYNKIVDKASEDRNAYNEICKSVSTRHHTFYDERRSEFGFVTTGDSRNLLYTSVLQEAAKKSGHLVRDRTLISEITGLVVKNGRIDHKSSGHDDHVIAWLLTHWFAKYARNVQHYGIDPMMVMKNVNVDGKQLSQQQIDDRERQEIVLAKIELLIEELKEATNEFEVMKIEHQIKALSNSIRSSDSTVSQTISAMIATAEEERQYRHKSVSNSQQSHQTSYSFRSSKPNQVIEYY
jgi:hypothetical protein